MRIRLLAAGVLVALAISLSARALDFSDFDDTLMRSMDDAIKELDGTVGAQDGAAALASAATLDEGLAWAEKYFANKPDAPLGSGFAREGRNNVAALVKALETRDYDAAFTHVRAVARNCKACHEAYKPPD